MRPRAVPPAPLALVGDDSAGVREIDRARAHYQAAGSTPTAYAFGAYAQAEVRRALVEAFGGKCAYCESPVTAVAPVDIEHYRPKGGVESWREDPPLPTSAAPLYFWLAATWTNLLPSCLSCNRVTWQTLADGRREKTGKGNFFPLETGSVRAIVDEEPTNERPLLLNPYFDAPEDHLRFVADGTVEAADPEGVPSKKGTTTIELLGLNREPLVRERRRAIAVAMRSVDNIVDFQRRATEFPGDPWYEWQIASELAVLEQHLQLDAPYSMAVAQVLGLSR